MTNISSVDIAILSKVNQLAARFKLQASDTEASLFYDGASEHYLLSFPSSPKNEERQERFEKMMKLLGCNEGNVLKAKDSWQMEDHLDAALGKAPRVVQSTC